MSTIGRLVRGLSWLLGSMLLSACNGSAAEPVDFENGIWMLSEVTRIQDGKSTHCRPMLMNVSISDESVKIGRRAYPCDEDTDMPRALTLRREGSSLYDGDDEVGSLSARRLEITLATGSRKIIWDLDRPDTPWQETGNFGSSIASYAAKLEKRINDEPVPIGTELDAVEDSPVTGWAHAAMLPEAEWTYFFIVGPANGTIDTFDAETGRFRLVPNKDFAGRDEFRFFVVDGATHSPSAPVGITFAGEPDPPIAKDMFITVNEDKSTTFFSDGYDPDGGLITLQIVSSPQHGQATAEGLSLTYKPDPDFFGSDSFGYVVDDGTSKSNVGLVHINVNAINDSPILMNQEVLVTSGSATPITLQVFDKDQDSLSFEYVTKPTLGQLFGQNEHIVYVPNPGVSQGVDQLTWRVWDAVGFSAEATVKFTISPGSHECTLLIWGPVEEASPLWSNGSRIYYLTLPPLLSPAIAATNGSPFGPSIIQNAEFDTFGFDNSVGDVNRTAFFQAGPFVYFSTSTKALGFRLYRDDGASATKVVDINPPGNNIASEPATGEAYVEGNIAYVPIHWRTTTQEYVCQVWKTDAFTQQTELVYSFPAAKGPCSGLHSFSGAQYMFVGPNLFRFAGMQSPPVVVKDLGLAQPTSWMVDAGGKLFFQTRTPIGSETQIDLWVTDGTQAGTKLIKQLETAFFELDVFSPTAFLDKLYFAHRKSLWSSDGTQAGTNIVATIPVGSVVGDGAIGTISVIGGKLYFLATSDASGREPWISDGTTAGTKLLRDIHPGTLGSSTASKNPVYFHAWNGQTYFLANDGASDSGLWTTDGTNAGTSLLVPRPMTTILGILGSNLVFHDGYFLYAMSLL